MINKKYLFIRTDRIGDFLLSAILIKSIKRSDKGSIITVIASEKNYNYIKKFPYVDEVIKGGSNLNQLKENSKKPNLLTNEIIEDVYNKYTINWSSPYLW